MQTPASHKEAAATASESPISKFLNSIEEGGVIIALSVMTLLYSLSIVSRYITKISMPWADELVRFLFIWATFLGTSIGVKKGAHLGVAVVQNSLPLKGQNYVTVAITVCCVFTCALLTWYGIDMVRLQFNTGQRSSQLGIPIYCVGLAIPVGLLLSLFRFIQAMYHRLRA